MTAGVSSGAMFGLLACPTYSPAVFAPPDPWEEFRYELVRPFLERNILAGVALLALAAVGTLIIGLFADLSASERRLCGALPLAVGVAAFVLVVFAAPRARWWDEPSSRGFAIFPIAWTIGGLGLLVLQRRRFIEDESLHLQRGHLPGPDDE